MESGRKAPTFSWRLSTRLYGIALQKMTIFCLFIRLCLRHRNLFHLETAVNRFKMSVTFCDIDNYPAKLAYNTIARGIIFPPIPGRFYLVRELEIFNLGTLKRIFFFLAKERFSLCPGSV